MFLQNSDNEKLKILVSSILENSKISEQEKISLLNLVKESGGLDNAYKTAEVYSQKARDALIKIEKMVLSEKQKLALEALNRDNLFLF